MTIQVDAADFATAVEVASWVASLIAMLIMGLIVYFMVRPSRRSRRRDSEAETLQLEEMVQLMERMERRLETLERAFPVYHSYFVRKWSRSLARKQLAWPDHYDFEPLLRLRNLRRMTNELVLAHTEYPTMDDYLAGYAITGDRLTTLTAPATVLTALDDPIIENADLARLARSPRLDIVTTAHGGHCGFIESLGGNNWVDQQVVKLLSRNPDR